MMDKAQLLALADRVEALTEPCYAVEDAIEKAIDLEYRFPPLAYTSSLDAAMTLVPEGMIARRYTAGRLVPHMWEVSRGPDNGGWIGNSDHASALALTAASLRAMAGGDDAN